MSTLIPLPPSTSLADLYRPGGYDWGAVADWFTTEATILPDLPALVGALADRLVAMGVPLVRLRIGAQTLHPEIAAWSAGWRADTQSVDGWTAQHGVTETATFINSPVQHMRQTQSGLTARLDQLLPEVDHPMLFELRDFGAMHYAILPVRFDQQRGGYLSMAIGAPGFAEADLIKLAALGHVISAGIAVHAHRQIAVALLETYVGKRTAKRVLNGHIRRGDADRIEAAFWYSDLRGFTQLSEELPPEALVDLLNTYFALATAAITSRGGEILQFIGDAVLAVFEAGDDVGAACSAAIDAAIDAQSAVAVENSRRVRAHQPPIRFGIGLHHGVVTYGNVGAFDRLGFNAVGPAVNRTARIESLTKDVGVDVLMSESFANHIPHETLAIGSLPMKGVAEAVILHRLVD